MTEVPIDVANRQVACRTLARIVGEWERRGHDLSSLVAGSGLSVEVLRDEHATMSWQSYRTLLGNARSVWEEEGFVELGVALVVAPWVSELAEREEEWRRLVSDLEVKNVELGARNAELERFTYTVSHDLKAPLVTIKGFLGFLEEDMADGDRDRVRIDIEQIGTATDHLERLLSELLELSRVGRIVNPPEEVELTSLARDAAKLVAGRIEERRVTVEIEAGMPTIFADRLRILEVYQNLIENAVKFMGDQPDARIQIGASRDEDSVTGFVRDNGLGIDADHKEKVFGLFDRLDHAIDGTGIGLALVRRIIEVHGGEIRVESEGKGQGSTFVFTLPARAPLAEEEPTNGEGSA